MRCIVALHVRRWYTKWRGQAGDGSETAASSVSAEEGSPRACSAVDNSVLQP